ncbi:DUF5420 family protein [Actinobacillus sp. GY-402]|nr:DUF5420 family protein [Actinobacillus sp. GY-402]QOF67423.1 DUF5420 family protein [Actinobacillus sp. GY-402]
MRPEFRYFKCSLDVEPIKSLKKEWDDLREERDKKLDAIFDTIPFYEFWRGSDNRIFGIVCNANNPEFVKIKNDKTYKIEKINDEKFCITGNKRTKTGKAFNAKIQEVGGILQKYPSFNDFMLSKLKLNCWVLGDRMAYLSVCGTANNHFILSIPVKSEEYGGDEFPEIPEFLIEIKQSEFLLIQGK